MEIHGAVSVAVHAHPDGVAIEIVLVPASWPTDACVGEMTYVQGAAACDTVSVRPPIVTVPVRPVVAALAATLYETVPLPVPLAPPVTVIHDGALLVAVHAHDVALAVTATVPLPPACVGELAVGEMPIAQTTPACVMPNVCPAAVMVAVRWFVLGLAVMLYETLPLPDPVAPLVIDTQDASSTAVHEQPAGMEMVMLPVAAAASTDTPVGEIVDVHGMPDCVTPNAWPAIVATPVRGAVPVCAAML
jgi:hypothetical protein